MNLGNDFINLTQGQLLVKYWFLWTAIVLIALSDFIKRKYNKR